MDIGLLEMDRVSVSGSCLVGCPNWLFVMGRASVIFFCKQPFSHTSPWTPLKRESKSLATLGTLSNSLNMPGGWTLTERIQTLTAGSTSERGLRMHLSISELVEA